MNLSPIEILPEDGDTGTLVGSVWIDGKVSGPRPYVVRAGNLYDLSALAATLSELFDLPGVAERVRVHDGALLGSLAAALREQRLRAPCDLQAIKAAGVTFADSLIERVIEERSKGDGA